MAEAIDWMYSVRTQSGPAPTLAGQIQADGYEKLNVKVPAGAQQDVTIGPGKWDAILAVVASASDVSGKAADKVSIAPKGGAAVALNGPLVLLGSGPVALLGAGDATFTFKNDGAADAFVDIFVARDATP